MLLSFLEHVENAYVLASQLIQRNHQHLDLRILCPIHLRQHSFQLFLICLEQTYFLHSFAALYVLLLLLLERVLEPDYLLLQVGYLSVLLVKIYNELARLAL